MGIGRFAFTPLLPLMQADGSLTVLQGGKLASANYAGYLLGALLAFALNPRPARAAKLGLIAVAASTLAMAFTSSFPAWAVLRFFAGVASAFVLVGVSAWALAVLARHERPTWSGWVFAGVGAGIVFAGLAVLAIGALGLAPAAAWLFLGGAASVVALFAARFITETAMSASRMQQAPAPGALTPAAWRLIVCYGVFGFGYIIPATFLPAASHALINNPAVFGWTWPVFGLAAAISTVVVASVLRNVTPRRSWAVGQMIMAAGVMLPAIDVSLPAMIVSAVCVGGTFVVITMAGMLEARRIGGRSAPRLMAAMTGAFAAGQMVGPLTVTGAGSAALAIRGPSLLAGALLILAALALVRGSETIGQQENPSSRPRRPP
jgi:predicted MFS family arabinose efflux permease